VLLCCGRLQTRISETTASGPRDCSHRLHLVVLTNLIADDATYGGITNGSDSTSTGQDRTTHCTDAGHNRRILVSRRRAFGSGVWMDLARLIISADRDPADRHRTPGDRWISRGCDACLSPAVLPAGWRAGGPWARCASERDKIVRVSACVGERGRASALDKHR